MAKKRTWKFWTSRTLLILLLIGIGWLINLIWFKPFNIKHFYDRLFVELALSSPEMTTSMGIPVIYDWYKDDLDDISDAKQWEEFKKLKADFKTLQSYDFESQSEANQLNTQILSYFIKGQIDGEPFFYHGYPVNQMFGIQSGLPDMMVNDHKLRDKSDAEAYITRLSKFDVKFDQLIEGLKISEEKGIVPPKFIIAKVLNEMRGFVGKKDSLENESPVLSNILYTNFSEKIDTLDFSDEEKINLKKQVEEQVSTTVFGAYNKLIAYFEHLDTISTNDAGAWKLPNGDAYYAYQLKQNTTTDYSPEKIHNIGLSEVKRIKKEMKIILANEGYDTTQTLANIMAGVNKEERFLWPDSDEGRQMILDEYDRILEEISAGIDDVFDLRPKADMEVKRIPEFKEEGAPGAYYNQPPMDGSRGGVFYANLRDVHETLKFGMKTLAYHEGIPGHHFQIAIQSEFEDVPIFRTFSLFTAYAEGWALYTEQLAWELGFYKDDPFGDLGRLQAEIFRAVRLVVDTGIHFKKWTREEAIEYMVENTGQNRSEVVTEIERYVVMPGQACAYKVGMMKILELRHKAKDQLGEAFTLKEFHNVVLRDGALPLDLLEKNVDKFIEKKKGEAGLMKG